MEISVYNTKMAFVNGKEQPMRILKTFHEKKIIIITTGDTSNKTQVPKQDRYLGRTITLTHVSCGKNWSV